ncbi:hypothetical protein CAC02_10480 [Streptococcus gallolyticus]|uniref:Uncharacterized protein n=1 Tax=Streptococcus gallolyticus TaxID=315405 RepID=A0A368UAP3_9STRE|nr:hypothetical protein [Streptococcus gallolyticus]RCW16109.1 hypothetical protein CAC02_10480 [Streptococcus gallolyticus]
MKKVFYKLSILVLTISLVFPLLMLPIHIAKAESVVENQSITNEEQKLADALQFMFDNAVSYDQKGNVKDINFDVIYEKYGYSEELAELEETVQYEKTLKADVGHCTIVAIQDVLGVAAISALMKGGITRLLQRKAATEIAKLVARTAIKNIAPAVAAASLIWSFGRCMWF